MGIGSRLIRNLIKDVFIADISFDLHSAVRKIDAGVALIASGVVIAASSRIAPLTGEVLIGGYSIPTYLLVGVVGCVLIVAGLVLALHDFIRVKYAVTVKRESAERELPFVALYMSLITASGLPIQVALDNVKNLTVFPHFKKEFAFLKKVMSFYAYSTLDALDFISRTHPSNMVRDFYKSLVVSERTGGVTYSFLVEKSKAYVQLLEDRVKRLIDNFSMLTNIEILLFVVFPVGVISVAIMFAGRFGLQALTLALVLQPLISFAVINSLIESMLAKELIETPPMRPLLFTFIALIFGAVLAVRLYIDPPPAIADFVSGTPYSLAVLVFAITFAVSIPATFYYEIWRRNSDEFIYSLPLIARSMTEEVRKGKTPRQAIKSLIEFNLGERLSNFIRALTARIISGFGIAESLRGTRIPWLARMYFELVDIADKMGADPKPLDLLSTFVSSAVSVKRLISDRALSFKAAAAVAISALAVGVYIVVNTVGPQFKTVYQNLQNIQQYSQMQIQIPINPLPPEQIPALAQVGYAIVILNSFILGLLAGKLVHGSLAYGLKDALIFMLISLAVIILMYSGMTLLPISR